MKKVITVVILSLVGFTGCTKKPIIAPTPSGQPALVVNARDTLAAASGFVANAQKQYLKECNADPTQEKCKYINQAVSGINATITAEEAYCGWSAGTASQTPAPSCVPVSTAAAGLQAAITNLNNFISQLKGAIQ